MIIVGIDPGQSGGLAVLPVDPNWRLKAEPFAVKFGNLTEKEIADLFWKIYADADSAGDKPFAILELVHAMPATKQYRDPKRLETLSLKIAGRVDPLVIAALRNAGVDLQTKVMQGSVGTFTFGQNYGFLRGCLRTVGIEFEEVRAQDWQMVLGCRTRGDKNISKAKAQQIFPTVKCTHAISDALLLAEFGRRTKRK